MAKEKVTYTEEQKAEALARVEELGIRKAAKEVNIPWPTVSKWAAEAGIQKTKKKASDQIAVSETEVKKAVSQAGQKLKETVVEPVETMIEDMKETVDKAKLADEMAKGRKQAEKERKKEERQEEKEARKDALLKPVQKAKAAKMNIVFQSPMGGSITPEEVAKKVPKGCTDVYVRIDENKIYWVKKEETGSVDIW